jgi:hypothetical protein
MTSMERHIQELVDHLRHGEDSQAGFYSKIDAALAHARYLEDALIAARKDVADIERRISIATPPLHLRCEMLDMAAGAGRYDDISNVMQQFDWTMEPIRYRVMLREGQARSDETLKARIKRATYRGMLRKFREQFDACFNLNPAFHRQAAMQKKILAAVNSKPK